MISTELKKLVDFKNECCCEYHLAHKCKEWANLKGYDVLQCVLTDGKSWVQLCEYENVELRNKLSHYIHGSCEQEAIFKACEWILERTK